MALKSLRGPRVVVFAAGIVLVLAAVVAFGWFGRARGPAPAPAPSSGPRSLQVQIGSEDVNQGLDRQVRCFAGGQYVGMLSLSACADRNGVEPGAMDVGIDAMGTAEASVGDGSEAPPASDDLAPPGLAEPVAPPPVGACWLNAGTWRKLGDDYTLDACVQALFAGRCAAPGSALYGRWSDQTLRLFAGRVERSNDNRTFQLLARQTPGNCAVPHIAE
jgi:hypothetical protein